MKVKTKVHYLYEPLESANSSDLVTEIEPCDDPYIYVLDLDAEDEVIFDEE